MGWIIKLVLLSLLCLVLTSVLVISLNNKQIPASLFNNQEISSPSDWVKNDQIKVYKDKVILEVKKATWASFTDTNSMDPLFDKDSNALEIVPEKEEDVNVGDIVAYQTAYGVIVHRVVEKGEDEDGVYFLVKGDNNQIKDPFKVRFSDIKGVVIAIIY
ncbi:hypothetical protein COY27_05025 [Candidatus Woesearchaeota archaeon CG_4_10_14_0_2_um_filter_33_13]|nr:MAG: hypothetical protein COY27_05025 [Candidatus Woesearchaeota archaeon CG_4_10_14_0_2_um_filter_33_13]